MTPGSSATELSWAAGFFDGEGTVCVNRSRGEGYSHCMQLQVQQKDPRPLERFAAATGGKVAGPYGPYGSGRAAMYVVRFYRNEAERVAGLLRPYLSMPKLEQLERVERALS